MQQPGPATGRSSDGKVWGPTPVPASVRPTRERLVEELAEATAQVAALDGDRLRIVAASADSNADDEHDPEGATVAFERQQVAALSDQARRRVTQLHEALARWDDGNYGVCERCGHQIAPERLAARPSATTCITCA